MSNARSFPHLLQAPLLDGLEEGAGREFLDRCEVRTHESSERILTQGDPSPGMFLVAKGLVEVVYHGTSGAQTVLRHAEVCDVVGEIEATSGMGCLASCMAMPQTTLLYCPGPLLQDYLRVPEFVRNLATLFSSRMARNVRVRAMAWSRASDGQTECGIMQLGRVRDGRICCVIEPGSKWGPGN